MISALPWYDRLRPFQDANLFSTFTTLGSHRIIRGTEHGTKHGQMFYPLQTGRGIAAMHLATSLWTWHGLVWHPSLARTHGKPRIPRLAKSLC